MELNKTKSIVNCRKLQRIYLYQLKLEIRQKEMAKNTSSSAFRKINVDQYNEDNFKEDEIDSNGTTYMGPDDAEITKFINTGKNIDALKLLLENAPLTSKNQQAKVNLIAIGR